MCEKTIKHAIQKALTAALLGLEGWESADFPILVKLMPRLIHHSMPGDHGGSRDIAPREVWHLTIMTSQPARNLRHYQMMSLGRNANGLPTTDLLHHPGLTEMLLRIADHAWASGLRALVFCIEPLESAHERLAMEEERAKWSAAPDPAVSD